LLIREAGGRVTNYDGDDWTLTDHTIVASNGQPDVHDGMLDAIRTARESLEESLM
jgi:myo-inositol-1(or 4)-monophosphatase